MYGVIILNVNLRSARLVIANTAIYLFKNHLIHSFTIEIVYLNELNQYIYILG